MKARESGMPDEAMWREFFDAETILRSLELGPTCGDVVEFGCGYGTFTLPAARLVAGTVHALDIEADMVAMTRKKAADEGLQNVQVHKRDFVAAGTGLADSSAAYAMLFNILHIECPEKLLTECFRILRPGGRLGILHWNYDPATPRGPSMSIRPKPEQCAEWSKQAGFQMLAPGIVDLPPYHYGIVCRRPE
jgi:ubiquinone/menaquinone biosynthesis C-methylase UbiE